jgi:hypothetical protein
MSDNDPMVSSSDDEEIADDPPKKEEDEIVKVTDDGGVTKKILVKGKGWEKPKKGMSRSRWLHRGVLTAIFAQVPM